MNAESAGALTAVDTAAEGRPEPTTIAETGLTREFLYELTLRSMYYAGSATAAGLVDALGLAGSVVQEILSALSRERLIMVLGGETARPMSYEYAITEQGIERAQAAMERTQYVGVAPVPFAAYVDQVERQRIRGQALTRDEVERCLSHLVLDEATRLHVGRAAASRKPTLVYGPSGNGKTSIVQALGGTVSGDIYIPYAIEVLGHVIRLYDPSKHVRVDEPSDLSGIRRARRHDRRWVRIRRPAVWVGGELTRHSLELVWDERSKTYEAPIQLKANGGTLIIDDFGRQQIPAVELLNRWIVALEGGVDHLTFHTGQTLAIPFDVLVLFSTNLDPSQLADDAFLRRIRYKIEVRNPTEAEFREIFRREAAARGLAYDEGVVDHVLRTWYHGRELRGCHPKDIIEAVLDAAQYEGREAALTREAVDDACETYFLHEPAR
ncbi:MAG TPA: ATP-binding protein [Dehalococcoidia bacterium]|nr:ATP-binding protein [Dehalococcoidia bacterium]